MLFCNEDYWTIQATEELQAGKEAIKRYDPAEIKTENLGVIRVEAKRPRRSELAKLLRDIRKFLMKELQEVVSVVWG